MTPRLTTTYCECNLSPTHIPELRYEQDRNFKNLVDTMHYFIQKADYTPTEIREAALLACIHHDRYTVRHIYLDPQQFELSSLPKKEQP